MECTPWHAADGSSLTNDRLHEHGILLTLPQASLYTFELYTPIAAELMANMTKSKTSSCLDSGFLIQRRAYVRQFG